MATVDVIVPAYNAAKFLPYALDSVLAQDFGDWQIVLVDDGSTDGTANLIQPYRQQLGSKLTCIRQENRGMSAARNTAIRSSTSEFVAMLDADDIWLPGRLTESLNALRTHSQAGLAYGGITLIDETGQAGATFEGSPSHAATRIAPQLYTREIHLPSPTVTVRRRCLEDVGVFDESLGATEDRDLWLRIALRYEVIFIPKVIAYYRVSAQSVSKNPQRMLQGQLDFIRKNFNSMGCNRRMRRIALAHAYREYAETLSLRGRFWLAAAHSLRAVTLNPLDTGNLRSAVSLLLSGAGLRRTRPSPD